MRKEWESEKHNRTAERKNHPCCLLLSSLRRPFVVLIDGAWLIDWQFLSGKLRDGSMGLFVYTLLPPHSALLPFARCWIHKISKYRARKIAKLFVIWQRFCHAIAFGDCGVIFAELLADSDCKSNYPAAFFLLRNSLWNSHVNLVERIARHSEVERRLKAKSKGTKRTRKIN